MKMDSLRADGWQDAAAFFLMTIVALFFWYINNLYFNSVVFIAGIGAGVIAYFAYNFAENRPVAGFPITMGFVVIMTAAVMIKSLVVGVVSSLMVMTAIKLYEVYS